MWCRCRSSLLPIPRHGMLQRCSKFKYCIVSRFQTGIIRIICTCRQMLKTNTYLYNWESCNFPGEPSRHEMWQCPYISWADHPSHPSSKTGRHGVFVPFEPSQFCPSIPEHIDPYGSTSLNTSLMRPTYGSHAFKLPHIQMSIGGLLETPGILRSMWHVMHVEHTKI